jgi:hypothetical protein
MLNVQNQYEPPASYTNGTLPPLDFVPQSLIPFTYSNGMLDIDFTAEITLFGGGTTFPDTMMSSISNQSVPHFPTYFNFPMSSQIQLMGGTNLVTKIGPNFNEYIAAIYGPTYEGDTVINTKVYSPGIVTKVRVLDITSIGSWLSIINPLASSSSGPPYNTYLSGNSETPPIGNYESPFGGSITYVFTQPLTIAVTMQNTGTHYFTLKSQISSGNLQ